MKSNRTTAATPASRAPKPLPATGTPNIARQDVKEVQAVIRESAAQRYSHLRDRSAGGEKMPSASPVAKPGT